MRGVGSLWALAGAGWLFAAPANAAKLAWRLRAGDVHRLHLEATTQMHQGPSAPFEVRREHWVRHTVRIADADGATVEAVFERARQSPIFGDPGFESAAPAPPANPLTHERTEPHTGPRADGSRRGAKFTFTLPQASPAARAT